MSKVSRGGSAGAVLVPASDGRFVSVDEQGLLAERVNQDNAAAAVVAIRGETCILVLQENNKTKQTNP